jgi:Mce-associated membrane protein
MNPTLYDVLGVPPDASRDEIRAAWRAAADRFEPGEGGGSGRQFRLFNEAAEVLLDPRRRAEYDAGLAPYPRDDEESAQAPSEKGPLPPVSGGRTTTARRTLPWVLVVPLALVAAAAVALATHLTVEANRAEAYEQALRRAPAAAENAAAAVLAYDFETLEADRDAAAKFLTPEYREDYVETFDALVVDNATATEAVVTAEVLASAPMAVSGERDADRVDVLLFVNQETTSSTTTAGEPSVALNRVRLEMVRVDDGWLVDDITSY